MSTIRGVFEKLHANCEGALVGYVMAGDPTPQQTLVIVDALIKGGIDVLELGLPFSDPIADGPTIQAASVRALSSGTTPKVVLELARKIGRKHNTPIVVMTYYNPVFRMGVRSFFDLAKSCSVDGLIIPDLPPEEAMECVETAKANNVDMVFLVTPSTPLERLSKIIECSSGFLYLVSQFGITGERLKVEESTVQLIKRTLSYTSGRLPLVVGFGISKPEHARLIVEAGADGVIVGSAFVNLVQKNKGDNQAITEEVCRFAQQLKTAMKRQY